MNVKPHPPREARIGYRLRACRAVIALFLLLSTCSVLPANASGDPAGYFVQETGHVLADPFLGYWIGNNGSGSLGLPVSDIAELDGRTAQYFQFGVLVLKQNGVISRVRAGADLLDIMQHDHRSIDGRRLPSPPGAHGSRPTTVGQTRTDDALPRPSVAPDFRSYWQAHGGIDVLGEPVSPAYVVGTTRMQWFEFGRIDLIAGDASLAEVGLALALRNGVSTGQTNQGHLPPFDPDRFVSFTGDGTIPNASQPFDPVRLEIPTIEVDAPIEITTVQDGVMTNPVDPWKAGWYAGFARPGDWTNTVIAGHRDWWGYGPVVFWNLGLVQPGDAIYLLAADGTGATYVVESNTLVPRTIDPRTIIDDVGYEALTLITCGGTWTGTEYTARIIIRARRI